MARMDLDGAQAVESVGSGWHPDCAVLLLTYRKNERYIPAIRQNLDMFWRTRPVTYFVTDGDARGDDILASDASDFVTLLRDALARLRQRQPGCRYVYTLLEDLCPLAEVDADALLKLENHMRSHGAKFFYLPWRDASRHYFAPDLEALNDPVLDYAGMELMPLDRTAFFFNALVVSFWDLDYLDWVIDQKLAAGITDPWGFELPVPGDMTPHYFAGGEWPTVRSGFLEQGKLNLRAVLTPRFKQSPLRRMLERDLYGWAAPIRMPLKRFQLRFQYFRRYPLRPYHGPTSRMLGRK